MSAVRRTFPKVMKTLTTVPKGGQTSDLPNMAPTRPQSKDGTAPLPPLGPPRSGNCVTGQSPSLSGPSRRRRHACECGPTLPGLRSPRGSRGTAPGGAREQREGAGKARGWRRGRGRTGRGGRGARGGAPQDGGRGVRGGAGGIAACPTLTHLRVPAVSPQLAKDLLHPSPEEEKRKHKKKRLVQSPNSYFMDVKCPGGHRGPGRALPRVPSCPSMCPGAVRAVPLPFPVSRCLSTCFPVFRRPFLPSRALPPVPPGVSGSL